MNVPKQTGEIFELLSKGQFICSNSSDSRISKLCEILDDNENFELLYEYFYSINFIPVSYTHLRPAGRQKRIKRSERKAGINLQQSKCRAPL